MEKEHWKRLKEELEKYRNGTCKIDFQDALPIRIVEIEGKKRDVDLTRGE